ncbi:MULTISPECIES: type 2 periplasmic-binding domain-containing protein [Roseivirga]|uniref:Uracil-DNA glycosylase n=1 Tax=Roseivirga spongicola TaxID=333140 RepID=A0A150X3G6_9BACT|nr:MULTISPECIES: uracil-DNA glycosylase [Roseivirga]KYG73269.1 uracil-DNA glycosylase [Roseivirga spongicola]MBO6659490.1 uracil-DNA glycosylase [Roseivirga sp.]MBO6761845.1 uracil-DNA glycosylase [Roseivirga sp.]MBO6907773.1 uracil-DNA glycosylase [Roseivirga sp.]WPZ10119.1 uracil-DNA glycosylase [Roseivirga spongicola]
MTKINIRVGGVPEHFNLPIHQINENGTLDRNGISLEWTDFYGGTGQMTKALREGEVDICILLTEGIVKDIIKGSPSKIISEYVITPLTWGIHTGLENSLQKKDFIFDKKHAISRFGSGSHLISIVNANSKNQQIAEDQFTVINDINGAIKSLNALETDVFYWEKYTTKPYVDAGIIRRIDEYLTPWPCFVIAATDSILEKHPEQIDLLLDLIQESCKKFMKDDSVIPVVAERYDQQLPDVERWYHSTEWATNSWVSDKMLKSVIYHLKSANIINEDEYIPELIWKK